MLCKIWDIRRSDYEDCGLPGYKNPVSTSQETHYVSATDSSQLMLCKIWGFDGCDYEEWSLVGCDAHVLQERIASVIRVERISDLGTTLALSNWSRQRSRILLTLMMEAIRSSKALFLTWPLWHHITEDDIIHFLDFLADVSAIVEYGLKAEIWLYTTDHTAEIYCIESECTSAIPCSILALLKCDSQREWSSSFTEIAASENHNISVNFEVE
jgi:hypothetical protein